MWLPPGVAIAAAAEEEEEEEWAIGGNNGKETGIAVNRRPTETRGGLLLSGCFEPF